MPMYGVYATLPAPLHPSEMDEMLVSSEEYYREIGERDRQVIEIDLFDSED
jgi:hypothetical protein